MSLHVVTDHNLTFLRGEKATVTLESDAPSLPQQHAELSAPATQHLAIQHAQAELGLGNARVCSLRRQPYGMTADGKILTDPSKEQLASYRLTVELQRGGT